MILELKHIQHYPIGGENGLKVKFIDANYKKHFDWELEDRGMLYGLNYFPLSDSYLATIQAENGVKHNLNLADIKPILRPMSDSCKPLPNGEIPAIELAKLTIKNKPKTLTTPLVDKAGNIVFDYKIITKPFGKVLKVTNFETWIVYLSFDKIFNAPAFILQYLFEHHFDVFGLIDQGLAININMIE